MHELLKGQGLDNLPVLKNIPAPPKRITLSAMDCKILCKLAGIEYLEGFEGRVLEYVITNETADRYGDIVRAKGVDLTNYRREPVIHLSHDTHKFPVGNSIKVWYDSVDQSVKAWALFFDDRVDRTGLSDTAFRFCSGGYMKGASVGFLPRYSYTPKSAEEREEIGLGDMGREYKSCELLEWSVCSVPCNPDALTQMSKQIKSTEALLTEMGKHNCRYCTHDHKCGCGDKAIDAEQLKKGLKIEREHKGTIQKIRAAIKDGKITLTDEAIYALIATDHLNEIPDYYTKLEKIEEKKTLKGGCHMPKPGEEITTETTPVENKDMHDKMDGIAEELATHHKDSVGHHKAHKELATANKDLSEGLAVEMAVHKAKLEELAEAHKSSHAKIEELCNKIDDLSGKLKCGDEGEDDGDGTGKPGSKDLYASITKGLKGFRDTIHSK
jgi:phage head maturation protease